MHKVDFLIITWEVINIIMKKEGVSLPFFIVCYVINYDIMFIYWGGEILWE